MCAAGLFTAGKFGHPAGMLSGAVSSNRTVASVALSIMCLLSHLDAAMSMLMLMMYMMTAMLNINVSFNNRLNNFNILMVNAFLYDRLVMNNVNGSVINMLNARRSILLTDVI